MRTDNEPNDKSKISSPQQKIGKNMMVIGWLIFFGLLTLVFGNWEEDQYNPNRNIGSEITASAISVTLEQNAYNHYVTNGKINGQDVIFMLDTGATSVAVPPHIAEKLNLKRGRPYQVTTANGKSTVYATTIDSLDIGAITLYNVKAAIATGMKSEARS